ncbi:MAG: hypothetical protein ACLSDJ_07150 [Butyricimonas faecihominis]
MDTRLQDKISAGESKVLEFKEILPQGDKIAKTVTASSLVGAINYQLRRQNDKGDDPDVDIFEDVAGRSGKIKCPLLKSWTILNNGAVE